jgi:hypothetical protein
MAFSGLFLTDPREGRAGMIHGVIFDLFGTGTGSEGLAASVARR